jgi:hypothetical protein
MPYRGLHPERIAWLTGGLVIGCCVGLIVLYIQKQQAPIHPIPFIQLEPSDLTWRIFDLNVSSLVLHKISTQTKIPWPTVFINAPVVSIASSYETESNVGVLVSPDAVFGNDGQILPGGYVQYIPTGQCVPQTVCGENQVVAPTQWANMLSCHRETDFAGLACIHPASRQPTGDCLRLSEIDLTPCPSTPTCPPATSLRPALPAHISQLMLQTTIVNYTCTGLDIQLLNLPQWTTVDQVGALTNVDVVDLKGRVQSWALNIPLFAANPRNFSLILDAPIMPHVQLGYSHVPLVLYAGRNWRPLAIIVRPCTQECPCEFEPPGTPTTPMPPTPSPPPPPPGPPGVCTVATMSMPIVSMSMFYPEHSSAFSTDDYWRDQIMPCLNGLYVVSTGIEFNHTNNCPMTRKDSGVTGSNYYFWFELANDDEPTLTIFISVTYNSNPVKSFIQFDTVDGHVLSASHIPRNVRNDMITLNQFDPPADGWYKGIGVVHGRYIDRDYYDFVVTVKNSNEYYTINLTDAYFYWMDRATNEHATGTVPGAFVAGIRWAPDDDVAIMPVPTDILMGMNTWAPVPNNRLSLFWNFTKTISIRHSLNATDPVQIPVLFVDYPFWGSTVEEMLPPEAKDHFRYQLWKTVASHVIIYTDDLYGQSMYYAVSSNCSFLENVIHGGDMEWLFNQTTDCVESNCYSV